MKKLAILSLFLLVGCSDHKADYIKRLIDECHSTARVPVEITKFVSYSDDGETSYYDVTIRFNEDTIIYKYVLDYFKDNIVIEPLAIPTLFIYGTESEMNDQTILMEKGSTIRTKTYLTDETLTYMLQKSNPYRP